MEHWKMILFQFMGEAWVSKAKLIDALGPVVIHWIAELIGTGRIKVRRGYYRITPEFAQKQQEKPHG